MRLTIKNEIVIGGYAPIMSSNGMESQTAILSKLGQLEDIEEELGIDLLTLLKECHSPLDFMKRFGVSKAWIFTEYVGKNKKLEGKETLQKCECGWYESGDVITFDTKDGWHTNRKISDYGKTWALTKEELL